MTISWSSLFREASKRLATVSESPEIDARRIIERAAGFEPAEFATSLDELVTTRQMVAFDSMIERRLTGEPLQYVIGGWAFRSIELMVDRRVLIPRPETEIVAGHALAEFDRTLKARGAAEGTVVDLGTGSGAIGLSVAFERGSARVWATDVDPDALHVARANLAGIGRPARNVTLAEGSWFAALPATLRGAVDVIVSNPPYVAIDDQLPPEIREWEPMSALVPGPTGYESYEAILGEARQWLQADGALVLEIGATQAERVTALALEGGFVSVVVHRDLNQRDRVVVARP